MAVITGVTGQPRIGGSIQGASPSMTGAMAQALRQRGSFNPMAGAGAQSGGFGGFNSFTPVGGGSRQQMAPVTQNRSPAQTTPVAGAQARPQAPSAQPVGKVNNPPTVAYPFGPQTGPVGGGAPYEGFQTPSSVQGAPNPFFGSMFLTGVPGINPEYYKPNPLDPNATIRPGPY